MFIIFVELVIIRILPFLSPLLPWVSSDLLDVALLSFIVFPMLFIVMRRFKLVSTVASEQQIQLRLFIVTGFPLTIALFYIMSSILDITDKLTEHQRYEESKNIVTSLDHVISELQNEREIAAFYIHDYKNTTLEDWESQSLKTDHQLKAFQKSLSLLPKDHTEDHLSEQFSMPHDMTQKLNSFRSDLKGSHITLNESLSFYSPLIHKLITFNQSITNNKINSELTKSRMALVQFLLAKEYAIYERTLMTLVYDMGRFSNFTYHQHETILAAEKSYLNNFMLFDSSKNTELYTQQSLLPEFTEIITIRNATQNFRVADLFSSVSSRLGFGGAIHHFKNYLLRHESADKNKFTNSYNNIIRDLNALKAILTSNSLSYQHVQAIYSVMEQYHNNIDIAEQLINQGKSTTYIDEIVKVDDFKAIVALEYFNNLLTSFVSPEVWYEKSSKRIQGLSTTEQQIELNNSNYEKDIYDGIVIELILLSILSIILCYICVYLLTKIVFEIVKSYKRISHLLVEADQSSIAKSEFLATMSHEIRTPMNGIIGLTELIKDTKLSKLQKQYISKISSSADSLLAIINDILDFSKIEAGKIELDMQEIHLKEFMDDVFELFSTRAADSPIKFSLSIDNSLDDYIISDPVRLRQIISNLMSNAIKFTDAGTVSLSVSDYSHKDQTALMIEVSDTGIGLTKEQQNNIFRRFKQADSSTTRKYGGTGLGLAISKQLARLLKGDIKLRSEVNSGTTFSVTFPCEFVQHSTSDVIENEEKSAKFPPDTNILLVEDNRVNQIVAKGMFKKLGFKNISITNHGLEALELIKQNTKNNNPAFQLIFMDCQMPELDGYETTKKLRKKKITIPIIAMTANAMKGDREKCIASGMDDYLSKPIDMEKLVSTIQKWI